MAKRDLSKPLSESIFDPRDRNKDGVVDEREKAYAEKMKKFRAGRAERDAKAAAGEAQDKMSKQQKQRANAKAKNSGKKQPYPGVGTGPYSGRTGKT
tara:strand:- start:8855 stop:9145 length:291 start_codon:yes stop_codon:yes gene_type:complete